MYAVKLQWKQFLVDLASMEAWVKAQTDTCVGNSADNQLALWFTADPTVIPMHDVQVPTEVTTQVEVLTLDANGDPQEDANGNPITHMEDQVSTVMTTISEPTGEPSLAQKIEDKWASIQADSDEAVAYAQKAQMAAISKKVAEIAAFSTTLLNQFNAENIAMGITADNKTEDVLDIMLPVVNALQSGAPTIAIKRVKAIPSASYIPKYVTAARLLSYVNKIEAFLELPVSSSL